MSEKYEWETKRDFRGGMPTVDLAEAEKVIEFWRNAVLCDKPRGSCYRLCKTRNCYYKSESPVLS